DEFVGNYHTMETLLLFHHPVRNGRIAPMRALTFLARRFVAGDQIGDAIGAVRALNAEGLKATLDNLGEDSTDKASALAAADEKDVDANYDKCAAILATAPVPAIATHDDARIEAALKAFDAAGLVKSEYELQMLYGIRAKRARELRAKGHTVRIYVPYGTHWF